MKTLKFSSISGSSIFFGYIYFTLHLSFHPVPYLLENLHMTLDVRAVATETLSRKTLDKRWTITYNTLSIQGGKNMFSATKAQYNHVSLKVEGWHKINDTLRQAYLILFRFGLLHITGIMFSINWRFVAILIEQVMVSIC